MKISRVCGPALLLSTFIAIAAMAEESPLSTPRELLAAHNKEREAEKLPPYTLDETLSTAARLHAEDMAARHEMTHEGADGSKPRDRTLGVGYRDVKVGENVARGQRTVDEVMKAWMESEGHRKNILGDYAQIGASMVEADDGEAYWCVVFGTPRIRLDPDVAEKAVAEGLVAARKEADKSALKVDPKAAKAARAFASEMAESSAKAEEDRKPPDLAATLQKAGVSYRNVAIVVGGGNPTAEDFVKSLLEDESRKEPIMGDWDAVGIGYAADAEDAPFWCVLLVEE